MQSGAEATANKTEEGAKKAGNAVKNAVTGEPSGQTGQTAQGESATGSQKLPQSASPLPLLALLGLGSFSLGAWKARLFRK